MITWHIHIEGQVQGIGFRPMVYLLAQEYGFVGWVNNDVDGLHIEFNALEEQAIQFKKELLNKAPDLAQITSANLFQVEPKRYDDFQIVHSKQTGATNLLLSPDFALCSSCRTELYEKSDRRKNYPFITCTSCGPRYSIIHQLPYDRVHTKMDAFEMCPTCEIEYSNPLDRRYYSQTNSCPNCSIQLSLYNNTGVEIEQGTRNIIDRVVQLWNSGKIVAIKGIGGYLLTCDANNDLAIASLRKKKHRLSKPLAIMYPNLEALHNFRLNAMQIEELQSPLAPIVLLEEVTNSNLQNRVAPGLGRLGVMLPYTPLHDLLLNKFGSSIIATSANISNSPIVYQDEKALSALSQIADYILSNNRAIVIPQDDSLIQFSLFKEQKIILRRSRGMAPTYINPELKLSSKTVLAMGAMLKSTFSILHLKNTYISQYLGDLEHFDTQLNFQNTLDHFLKLLGTRPEIILTDKHPDYPSTRLGQHWAAEENIPTYSIQHHIAHFGAIIGEHDLIHSKHTVLGVIWDGIGMGNDGQIWGGEFFKYEDYNFQRCSHFDYFDFILGDKMSKEPRISALSACWDVPASEGILKKKFSNREWQLYNKVLTRGNTIQTSSVGRVFDTVASLLGVLDKQSYEGEAAMQLEALATAYFKQSGLDFSSSYFTEDTSCFPIPTKLLMANIIKDLKEGKEKDYVAAKFHFSLVQLIKMVANNLKIAYLTFSGGVFQNSLLVDLIIHHLGEEFNLFFHQQLSPNDENISFGQLICYEIEQQKDSFNNNKSKEHVFSDSR